MGRLWVSALVLNIMLVAPLWWRFEDVGSRLIAWEAWLMVPLILLLPAGKGRAWLVTVWLLSVLVITLLNLGDVATYLAFGRSFNSYLDIPLVRSVFELLVGNVGTMAAIMVSFLAALLLTLVFVLLGRLLLPPRPLALKSVTGGLALMIAGASSVLIALELNGMRVVDVARVPMVNTGMFQWQQITQTHTARKEFTATLANSPIAVQPLPGLADKRVLLTFVESYGASAIEDARYRRVISPMLDDMQQRLGERDISVASGWLESPIQGGQSWLAHASALSGRKIDNQLWYRLMLESATGTLVDDFKSTGHRTLAVMPAITRAWPEGKDYGFDEIHAAGDLEYAGPALNWVTMPDQYTLDYTARELLDDGPVFAQIALISSHAPWTPIIHVLENWSQIGNGALFARWENAGEAPDVLWQDLDRVRDHYARSVEYAVKVAGRWGERVADKNTLLIVLGDHQAAPLITDDANGVEAPRAVPVHIMSADPALIAPWLARGFSLGTHPPALAQTDEVADMHELRHWLRADYGQP
ncbi:alkaline phosphatase [Vreelandella aquamarina]